MAVWTIYSNSPEKTEAIGRRLGGFLHLGDTVFLRGDLGTGKTRMARGIAAAFGVGNTRSPSFALVHCYRGTVPVYHADLYRLDTAAAAEALDLAETAADGILVVEWPELVAMEFPSRLDISLEFDPRAENTRRIDMRAYGPEYETIIMELKRIVDAGD